MTATATPSTNRPPRLPSEEDSPSEQRRRLATVRASDIYELLGSAAAGTALAWLLCYTFTPLSGAVGTTLFSLLFFFATFYLVSTGAHGPLVARDRVATAVISAGAVLAFLPLVFIVGYVVQRGMRFVGASFFTETLQFVGPLDPPTAGGAAHAIVGTLEQTGIAIVLSVPLAIATALFINEIGGRGTFVVRFMVDAMSGLPSVVAGLFVYAVWILQLHRGYSGMAAGVALAVLMLPTVTRTALEMLRLVPGGLREGALALGATEWRVGLQVVLPTARSGLVTAAILGTARAVGETAPVLLTAFGSSVFNANPLQAPQEDLPLFVYRLIRSSQDSQIDRAWAGALVLLVIVLVLFTAARILAPAGGRPKRPRFLRRTRHGGSR